MIDLILSFVDASRTTVHVCWPSVPAVGDAIEVVNAEMKLRLNGYVARRSFNQEDDDLNIFLEITESKP